MGDAQHPSRAAGGEPVPPPPPEAFAFVDTAVGGAHNRNNVVRADAFAPPPGAVDCFCTYLRYTDDLLAYMETHRNASGEPSVAGYPGPSLARVLPLDFDHAADPAAALADARALVRRFCTRYDVPPGAVRAWFSGHKGIAIELPSPLFGGFEAGPDTAARLKALAGALAEGLATLDTKIYERVRLWRLENTVNGKSGLFKVPLTTHELLTLGLDEIRALAVAPRSVARVPEEEWEPVPDLVALWQGTAPRPRARVRPPAAPGAAARRLTDAQTDDLVGVLAPHWALGRKHDLALSLAGFLAQAGIGEDQALGIAGRLSGDDERPGDRVSAVRDSYRRHGDGQPTLGFAGLRELLAPAALGALEDLVRSAPRAADAPFGGEPGVGGRPVPVIDVADQDLARGSAAAWAAVVAANDPPALFVFGGVPARVDRCEAAGAPLPRPLTEDRLRHALARVAAWVRTTAKGEIAAFPPRDVVRDMLAAPAFPLPPLEVVAEVPAFAPDGSLPAGPGYHAAARAYYAPPPGFRLPDVPADPTRRQVDAARDLLLGDLLADFPFAGEAERAHALALVLLPLLRGLVDGPTPLHLVEKPAAGTGASLLADVAARLATGRAAAAMTEGRDEEEWRKRLTAKLRTAPAAVLLDNLRRPLDSAVLSSALTARYLEDRILGTSDTVRLPVRCVWVATGNNPALSNEIARRTVRIRLDAKLDRPWLRAEAGFKHHPLTGWVMQERASLVAACLTLGRAWLAAGRPAPAGAPSLGSFEAWSRALAGVLDVAGVGGFLGNLPDFYDASDTEGAEVRAFLAAWWDAHGAAPATVAELFALATAAGSALDVAARTEQGQRVRLGGLLRSLAGRRYGLGGRLTVEVGRAGTEQRAVRWRLVPVEAGGSPGEGGGDSPGGKPRPGKETGGGGGEQGESGESPAERPREAILTDTGGQSLAERGGEDSPDSRDSPDGGPVRPCVECGAPVPADRPAPYCGAPVPADRPAPYCGAHGGTVGGAPRRCRLCGAPLAPASRSPHCPGCDPATR